MSFKNTDILRNICVRNNNYLLQKREHNLIKYSETFKSLAEAILVRDELESVEYDVDLL